MANQPAGRMEYSPTREAINQWVKTGGKRGKLSYVYIQNGKGEYGYFVTVGTNQSFFLFDKPMTMPE
ncbi:hypothetical protein ACFXOY_07940 [Streptomyces niveus]|uniref:hypothetical protein n=1 Tax=Streptomyces niveus TaxID=193462 RepID=UPI0036925A16